MLRSASLLLGRAFRRKGVLLSCVVTNSETLAAVFEATDQHPAPVLLVVKAESPKLAHLLLATALWQIEHQKHEFAISLDLSHAKTESEIGQYFEDLTNWPSLSVFLPPNLSSYKTPQGWEKILDYLSVPPALDVHTEVNLSHAIAVRLPLPLVGRGITAASHQVIQHLKTCAAVPLIVQECVLTPNALDKAVQAGISGVTLDAQLQEAFTAGVRTALRSRTVAKSDVYLSKGRLAAANRITNYLQYLA